MSYFNGNAKVVSSAANTPTAIVARSQMANRVDIQALASNSGVVFIGDSTVKSDATNGGIQLNAGDVYSLELLTDIIAIFFATSVQGDGITYNYWLGDRN